MCPRWLMALLIVLIGITLPGTSGPTSRQPAISHVEHFLKTYPAAKRLGPLMNSVRDKLNDYDSFCTYAQNLSAKEQFDITILGQIHSAPGYDPAHEVVSWSQMLVLKDLTNGQFAVVGIEGLDACQVNLPTLLHQKLVYNRQHGLPADSTSVFIQILGQCMQPSDLLYAMANPKRVVFGAEDQSLLELQAEVLGLTSTPIHLPATGSRRERFHLTLVHLRSEMALAKLIVTLHNHQQTRGALVIGLKHLDDFPELAKRYHVTVHLKREKL